MTSLDDFLGGVKVTTPPAPPPEATAKDSGEEPVRREASASLAEPATGSEPTGVVELELPSGIQVYYQAGPKRLYRLRQLLQPKEGFADWRQVPSMSEITKVLDKPGLVHWGEKVGINLVQELLRNRWADPEFLARFMPNEDNDPPWFGGSHLQDIGKAKKLTNYYMKEAAASRGTSVHSALEGWAMSGSLMDPDAFSEHEQGYVRGLNRFLTDSALTPRMSEVIVASVEHEVAGRTDILGDIPGEVKLVTHLARGTENPTLKPVPAGSVIIDLKTSKGVYEDHHLQVAGYKGVLVESGYEEPERGYVLRVTKHGNYELVEITAEWEDFWFLRGLYDGLQAMEERRRARK